MLSIWYMNQIFVAFSQYLNFTNILNNYVLLFLASFCICNRKALAASRLPKLKTYVLGFFGGMHAY